MVPDESGRDCGDWRIHQLSPASQMGENVAAKVAEQRVAQSVDSFEVLKQQESAVRDAPC